MGRVTKYTVLLCALLIGLAANAQEQRKAPAYDTIHIGLQNMFDKPLTFRGESIVNFTKWCFNQIEYPEEALLHKISGRVTLQFIIDTAGIVSDVKVVRSAHPLLDNEAVRVVSSSPAWDPVTVKGRKANVRFTFPVVFGISKKEDDTSIVHAKFSHKGHTDFMSWVAENIEYPKEAAKSGFNGKVAVAFDVSAEGYVENARVLTGAAYMGGSTASSGGKMKSATENALASTLDAEAVRVVSASPRWIPAMKDGFPIKVSYNVLVVFQTE